MRKTASTRAGAVGTALAAALATLTGVAAPVATAETAATGCSTALRGDINGDGHADTVVTEYGRTRLEGGIHVLYGTSKGLTASPQGSAPDDQFLTQESPGIPGTSEPMDEWGASLALGDFDGDKCADLAVGAPGENEASGAVTIIYGSATGLVDKGPQVLAVQHAASRAPASRTTGSARRWPAATSTATVSPTSRSASPARPSARPSAPVRSPSSTARRRASAAAGRRR